MYNSNIILLSVCLLHVHVCKSLFMKLDNHVLGVVTIATVLSVSLLSKQLHSPCFSRKGV